LIDFIITSHPAYPELVKLGKEEQKNIHSSQFTASLPHEHETELHLVLQEILEKLRVENNVETLTELTKDLHIYPDFHGWFSLHSHIQTFPPTVSIQVIDHPLLTRACAVPSLV